MLPVKLSARTSESMKHCLKALEEGKPPADYNCKGVVGPPILDFDPANVLLALILMHDANGVWNKIWDFTTQKLQQMVDEPYMSRQGTALMMRARVVELDKKQQEQKALLTTLELQVQDLQEQKTVLTAYLNKLQLE